MGYEVFFVMMLVTWGVSMLYPWHPSWPLAKWLVHLPWTLLPMWACYEMLMPAGMNIRIDLLLIIGALKILFLVYIVRVGIFIMLSRKQLQ